MQSFGRAQTLLQNTISVPARILTGGLRECMKLTMFSISARWAERDQAQSSQIQNRKFDLMNLPIPQLQSASNSACAFGSLQLVSGIVVWWLRPKERKTPASFRRRCRSPLTKPPPHFCAEDACLPTSTLAQSAAVVQPRMKRAQARFTYKPDEEESSWSERELLFYSLRSC